MLRSTNHRLPHNSQSGCRLFAELYKSSPLFPPLVQPSAVTMNGLIAIEEAVQLPELAHEAKNHAPGKAADRLAKNLVDIHEQRLQAMNEYGVEMQVLSLTSPGPQGLSDRTAAEALARKSNNYLADQVAKNRKRFAAFCTLSMHDATQAAEELTRCVKEHGMVGAMINDFQNGPDGSPIYYDQPEYDVFWKCVQGLDVVVYMHPRFPHPAVIENLFGGRRGLLGACWSFQVGVGTHTLGLCTNGVFDRFPNLKFAIGHLGEHIVADLVRLDAWLAKNGKMKGATMKENIRYYLKKNIWITTSGNYNTKLLTHVIDEIGYERVIFSIDYPYDETSDAVTWWNSIPPSVVGGQECYETIGRHNAIKLLKLKI